MQSADSFIHFILPSLLELKHSKNCIEISKDNPKQSSK